MCTCGIDTGVCTQSHRASLITPAAVQYTSLGSLPTH